MTIELAHGVGRVYESPIPLSFYLGGAALTVLASFFIRAFSRADPEDRSRPLGGPGLASGITGVIRSYLLVVFGLVVAFSVIYSEQSGYEIAPLTFWICLIIIPVLLCAIVSGIWPETSPWLTLRGLYRVEEAPESQETRSAPAWLPPLLVYALFWFELISGKGFDPLAILTVVIIYSVYRLAFQREDTWRDEEGDPLGILFGFAQRIAPLEVRETRLYYRGFVAGLDDPRPMPLGLFLAAFVLLASTTLDNLRETVGWFEFLESAGLEAIDQRILDSVALLVLTLPFVIPFLACVWLARLWAEGSPAMTEVARRFGWSLIPIAIAYVLSHNMPLLVIGLPRLIQQVAEGFGSDLFSTYSASPLLVWIIEIGLIVGGHVIGVLAAHRAAIRVAGSHRAAFKSHVALTVLMSLFTITTLWLLSLPLVTT